MIDEADVTRLCEVSRDMCDIHRKIAVCRAELRDMLARQGMEDELIMKGLDAIHAETSRLEDRLSMLRDRIEGVV